MKESIQRKVFRVGNGIFMSFIVFLTLYPFVLILAQSLSDEIAVISGKVFLFPVNFSIDAYRLAIRHPYFWIGYRNTIIYVFLTIVIDVILTTLCAYPLSRKNLKGRKLFTGMIIFTMFFGGGMVPNYLLIRSLGMINTVWAIVLPPSIAVWHVMIMRTFFEGIPKSLEEAAEMDGLSPMGILLRIVIPLSKPILATIALFIAVGAWNSWFPAMIYLQENDRFPITLFLRNLVVGAQMAASNGRELTQEQAVAPAETLRSATIMLVSLPILCVYPFVQRYFVQGMMIGSLKG